MSSSVILKRYNILLKRNPLLTKCITGAVLTGLSELFSQWVSLSPEERKEKLNWIKVALMSLYGGLFNAPVNHFSYKWINEYTIRKVVSKYRSLVQLGCSLGMVSPIQVLGLLFTLTSVNNGKVDKTKIIHAIKTRYAAMLSSSLATSTVLMSIAQRYISPDKWSVFFSLAYAILGTAQNIYLKKFKK
ncbi:uncharacterized protein KLLA0_D03751g [Kluyveromyces lactis]|uniref:KLLA0D03751p n=1 Tax=Kluyveromyces lactis (strain ATCC 8585 / CBS 2359 / DSM 70799 / NBRC 1267 / NRRL Y-1140 / WM37) TaxID=284590 RepID=Q6CS57_KLULA|nr:uncharacterized protein KLLA0_D03751g [Kluyveromyces lactis]CAH00328.1 KLLA0D03751p [Kluyveromyces lactis]|eukprot:XP_453232.1 uncharacterized protein KLLA0_D03751g [Kluyveromyces lactis]